ncbi:MAG TPA: hypothetical protein DCS97_08755 [Planctomycetes bacterium]|nr:hypothetical protein [Planctomycetota bacterium]
MLNALLRLIRPRSEHFYGFLEKQAQLALDGAKALEEITKPGANAEAVRDRIRELEHQGDAQVHAMIDALSETFVTPIDREDLQRLSKRIDDILDLTNATGKACVTFGVEQPTPAMRLLIIKLVESTDLLNQAVPKLRIHAYPEALRICARVTISEKDGDVVYRDALSKLFHDPAIDAKTILREREVLDDLEKAINRCEQVADLITTVAVKQS